jgi:hypothetical protein
MRSSGSRKTKGVKGSGAITSEEWTLGSQILHRKTRSVKLDRTRIVSCKLTNRKKIMNHLRKQQVHQRDEKDHEQNPQK